MIKQLKLKLRKSFVGRVYNRLQTYRKKFNAFKKASNQKKAYRLLQQAGYEKITLLGGGKDGFVFKTEKQGIEKVTKVLSEYGRQYSPITEVFIKKDIKSPMLYNLSIGGHFLEYEFEKLSNLENSIPALLEMYIQVCQLQRTLLKNNLVFWDLGFTSPNFMQTEAGNLRLVDYGGNAFLFANETEVSISSPRKMLVKADNEFIQNILLTHLITFGIGKKKFQKWGSTLQNGRARFSEFVKLAEKLLNGTSFESLKDCILQQDLLNPQGWIKLEQNLTDLLEHEKNWTLEAADVDELHIKKHEVKVRGYQNYDATSQRIEALALGHSWTVSKKKFQLVKSALQKTEGDTYLDIGCNLGMYVFLARINFQLKSTGLDYNKTYIQNCNRINQALGLDCEFDTKSFSDINKTYDIVSCLGLIHHLYQRTETYNGLCQIILSLRKITKKYLIIEFPTEKDLKSREWIDFDADGTNREYSMRRFLDLSQQHFSTVAYLGSVADNRPVYLLGC